MKTNETIYRDGVFVGVATGAPASINYTSAGRTSIGAVEQARFFPGDTGSILLYSDVKSGSDQKAVERYLSFEWGIPLG